MSDPQSLLHDLIALPSVNPMGRAADENCYEHRVTDYLQQRFEKLGVSQRRCPVEEGRDNLLAWLPGAEGSSEVLVWEVHQDTVPVEGMSIPPFEAQEREGRLYGRGACDVKGGMAAMLSAFERLASQPTPPPVTVVLACSVNEEFGCSGATELAEVWCDDAESPFDRPPTAVIVAEPTELNVVEAHKGTLRWRCHTEGVAAHSSTPELGRNAIYEMARLVSALEDYARDVLPGLAEHPQLGRPTLSVGLIEGGVSVNVVPASCWIEIDRRVIPGEDPWEGWRHAVDYLKQAGCQFRAEEPYIASPPLPNDQNQALVRRLTAAAASQGVDSQVETAAYCSDASRFARWPTVVFGPGNIQQAHTRDEWIELKQLHQAAEIFYALANGWGRE